MGKIKREIGRLSIVIRKFISLFSKMGNYRRKNK